MRVLPTRTSRRVSSAFLASMIHTGLSCTSAIASCASSGYWTCSYHVTTKFGFLLCLTHVYERHHLVQMIPPEDVLAVVLTRTWYLLRLDGSHDDKMGGGRLLNGCLV